MSSEKENYIVIGGSGFLGRHVVEALLARGDAVSVLDIVQRHHDVPFYACDISVQSQVEEAFRKVSYLNHCVSLLSWHLLFSSYTTLPSCIITSSPVVSSTHKHI